MSQPSFPASPFAQIVWRRATITADGSDAGFNPDWNPFTGRTVTLRPSITGMIVYNQNDNPVTIQLEDVPCAFDANGNLVTARDLRPVYIAASDDANMSVQGWTWYVVEHPSIRFSTVSGSVVDLSDYVLAPAVDTTKTWVERIPDLLEAAANLLGISDLAEDDGDLVVTLSDGSTKRVPFPELLPLVFQGGDHFGTDESDNRLLLPELDGDEQDYTLATQEALDEGLAAKADSSAVSDALDNKLDKISAVNRVYVTDEAGNQTSHPITQIGDAGNIIRRTSSGGNFWLPTEIGESPNYAIHRKHLDDKLGDIDGTVKDALDGKVSTVTGMGAARVYTIDVTGEHSTLGYSSNEEAGTVAVRLGGGRLRAGSPLAYSDVVNLSFFNANTLSLPFLSQEEDEETRVVLAEDPVNGVEVSVGPSLFGIKSEVEGYTSEIHFDPNLIRLTSSGPGVSYGEASITRDKLHLSGANNLRRTGIDSSITNGMAPSHTMHMGHGTFKIYSWNYAEEWAYNFAEPLDSPPGTHVIATREWVLSVLSSL